MLLLLLLYILLNEVILGQFLQLGMRQKIIEVGADIANMHPKYVPTHTYTQCKMNKTCSAISKD